MAQHNETGKAGEALAAQFLKNRGYTVLHTNWKQGRNEVDIIACRLETIHFIEVKTLSGKGLALPEQKVNAGKLGRMKRVAEDYLFQNPGWKFVQFDIMSITLHDGGPEEYFLIEDVF